MRRLDERPKPRVGSERRGWLFPKAFEETPALWLSGFGEIAERVWLLAAAGFHLAQHSMDRLIDAIFGRDLEGGVDGLSRRDVFSGQQEGNRQIAEQLGVAGIEGHRGLSDVDRLGEAPEFQAGARQLTEDRFDVLLDAVGVSERHVGRLVVAQSLLAFP